MNDEVPDWLPNLILLEDYRGNWNNYIEAVYQHFYTDFIINRPKFENLPVHMRHEPAHENKGATFWHLISEGQIESERIPDIRRCERIRWPKLLIEKYAFQDIKIWGTIRPWKGKKQERITLSLDNFSYIVVLAKTPNGYMLITAYEVQKNHQREKLKKEFECQKKEGSAL